MDDHMAQEDERFAAIRAKFLTVEEARSRTIHPAELNHNLKA